jgi:hypothetical protein
MGDHRSTGSSPVFVATIKPGSVHSVVETASVRVQIGAGALVIVSSGGRTQTLVPPVAPYTYDFVLD